MGRYADASGVTHGLFFVPPNNFFTFDFPGSTFTSLNGISSQGNITGRYRRRFRHCSRIHSSRQRHTADDSGWPANEGERFPVEGRSTQPVALGVGRCDAGALSWPSGACG